MKQICANPKCKEMVVMVDLGKIIKGKCRICGTVQSERKEK